MSWIEHRDEIDAEIEACRLRIEDLKKKIQSLESKKQKELLDTPIKMAWSDTARGFYCPKCHTGVACKMHRCKSCGQMLVVPYDFEYKNRV